MINAFLTVPIIVAINKIDKPEADIVSDLFMNKNRSDMICFKKSALELIVQSKNISIDLN